MNSLALFYEPFEKSILFLKVQVGFAFAMLGPNSMWFSSASVAMPMGCVLYWWWGEQLLKLLNLRAAFTDVKKNG